MGTQHYNFTYLESGNQIDLVQDTTTFLDEIDNAIYTSDNKIMVAIGDSFTCDPNPYANKVWASYVAEYFNETLVNKGVGSAGFLITGNTFQTQLEQAAQEIEDANSVKHLICYGGYNDWYVLTHYDDPTYQDLANAIALFLTTAKELFPKAEIIFAPFNFSAEQYNNTCVLFNSVCTNAAREIPGIAIYNDAHFFLNPYPQVEVRWTDNVHPNTKGQLCIGNTFISKMKGGSPAAVMWNPGTAADSNILYCAGYIVSSLEGSTINYKIGLKNGSYTAGQQFLAVNSATIGGNTGKPINTNDMDTYIPYGVELVAAGGKFQLNCDDSGAIVFTCLENFTISGNCEIKIAHHIPIQ